MAAGNMKEIRRRIRSVQSTMKITKAMELVASSRLRRAKERMLAVRPYCSTMQEAIARIAGDMRGTGSAYTRQREGKSSLFVVIAGDRGLAGGYNSSVFKCAAAAMAGKNAQVVTIGKKAQEHFAGRPWTVAADYPGIAGTMKIGDTHPIARDILEKYRGGQVDEVFLCFTRFVSPLQQEPRCIRLLPVQAAQEGAGETVGARGLTGYDRSPGAVLDAIIPAYLCSALYGAVAESCCAEQSARRIAMEAASKSAGEMLDNLSLAYNQARQTAITQEITEIVAGAGRAGA